MTTTKTKEEKTYKSPLLDELLSKITPQEQNRVNERMKLAARIGTLMDAKGWTRAEFARKADVQPNVITKWLSGTHNFTHETLTDIAFLFNIDIRQLFDESESKCVFAMKDVLTNTGFVILNQHSDYPDIHVHAKHAFKMVTGNTLLVFSNKYGNKSIKSKAGEKPQILWQLKKKETSN
jgi:DNA-binding XRE family transcriptional regulator